MFCTHCGKMLPDGTPVCPACGTRLSPAPGGAAPAGPAYSAPAGMPGGGPVYPGAQRPAPFPGPAGRPAPAAMTPEQKKKWRRIGISAAVLLAVLLAAIWWALHVYMPAQPSEGALSGLLGQRLSGTVSVDGEALTPDAAPTVAIQSAHTERTARTSSVDCRAQYTADGYTVVTDCSLLLKYAGGWKVEDLTSTVVSVTPDTVPDDLASYADAALYTDYGKIYDMTGDAAVDDSGLDAGVVLYTYAVQGDFTNVRISGSVIMRFALVQTEAAGYEWQLTEDDSTLSCDWSAIIGTWTAHYVDDDNIDCTFTIVIDAVDAETLHISEELIHYERGSESYDDAMTTYEPDGYTATLYSMEVGVEYEYYSEMEPTNSLTNPDSIGVCYEFDEAHYLIFQQDTAYFGTTEMTRTAGLPGAAA